MTDQPMPADPAGNLAGTPAEGAAASSPDGAAKLSPASPTDGKSVAFKVVHAKELERLAWRRERVLIEGEEAPVKVDVTKGPDAAAATAHLMKPFGLAFSGGGIRSATFNLGILQGLAEHDLLRRVDYLSTVSGGGYIGSWLHGFIKHHCDSDMTEATCRLSPTRKPVEGPSMVDPIAFLRKYSNYLAPSPGLFSADTWVIAAIWLRNVLLNQLILVPALAVPMLLALMLVFGERWLPRTAWGFDTYHVSISAVVTLGLLLAAWGAGINLRPIVRRTLGTDTEPPDDSTKFKRFKIGFERQVNDRLRRPLEGTIVPILFVVGLVVGCTDFGSPDLVAVVKANPWLWRSVFTLLVSVPYFILAFGGGFVKHYAALHQEAPWLIRRVSWLRASERLPLWLKRLVPDFESWWKKAISPQWVAAVFIFGIALLAAFVTSLLLFELLQAAQDWSSWNRVALMPVLVHLVVEAGIVVFVGLMGADYPDGAREWVARIGTRLNLASVAWLALFAITVWGPWVIASGLAEYGKTTVTALLAWVATTGLGVRAGHSAKTSANESQDRQSTASRVLSIVIAIAPTVFMVGYLLLISFGVHALVDWRLSIFHEETAQAAAPSSRLTIGVTVPEAATPIEVSVNRSGEPTALDRWLDGAKAYAAGYFDLFPDAAPEGTADPGREIARRRFWGLALLLSICAGLAWLAARRININEFSLHHFYKNRLVRCYLGASHGWRRRPNAVTGFDPSDDFPVSHLQADFPKPKPEPEPGQDEPAGKKQKSRLKRGECDYPGPYPIINTTLNVNVGIELAQQERKAMSFVFTPEYCGFETWRTKATHRRSTDIFDEGGYRQTWGETHGYSAPDGPSIGQAMAISGAAANPNSGHATTNAMAFLLTVFDARLGWWLGNPRWRLASRKQGPSFALGSLLSELFAQTNARSKYVNLSDGGHFDNLGLYELVRRRCRYIIVGDGEQDGELTFGSLGGAIRKCRADFGVEIAIDPTPIRLQADGRSKVHCVVGTITYPEIDADEPVAMTETNKDDKFGTVRKATKMARGWLLYLKSSLTGNEPADVIEYQSRNPEFPHQSTGDQFFSESQFESYRRLGLHVVREALEGATPKVDDENPWTRPVVVVADAAKTSVAADEWMMQKCRETSPFETKKIDLTEIFQKLTTKWYPGLPLTDEAASRLNTEFGDLIENFGKLSSDTLLTEMLADRGVPPWVPAGKQPDAPAFTLLVQQLGLMENVFTEFKLEHAANRANPRNRGWMRLFRQWVASDHLYEGAWPRVKDSYNPVFQKFVVNLREKDIDDVPTQN